MASQPNTSAKSISGLGFWLFNASSWCTLAAANSGAIYADLLRSGRDGDWLSLWSQYLFFYSPWFFFTPFLFWWARRYPLNQQGWRRHGFRYVLLVLGWMAIYPLTAALIFSWVSHRSFGFFRQSFDSIPLNAWVLDSVFLLTLLGIASARQLASAAREQERQAALLAIHNAELETDLSDAKLQMLKAQLEPHFLFNCLNSITALIRSGEPETAVRSVSLLSELLRYATQAASCERVQLDEEVNFVEAYLGFQQLRFGDRLDCDLTVDPAAAHLEIPPLIVQPLLENAIRHGVEQIEGPSEVRLDASCRGDDLVIRVSNRPGRASESSGLGIGLANTRQRLETVYGEAMSLTRETDGDTHLCQLIVAQVAP